MIVGGLLVILIASLGRPVKASLVSAEVLSLQETFDFPPSLSSRLGAWLSVGGFLGVLGCDTRS